LPGPDALPHPTGTAGRDGGEEPDPLLARAREVDAAHRRTHRRPASVQTLKKELRVGQKKAQQLRDLLRGNRFRGSS
ncbi:hypothetical protein PV398_46475, partial [Streptomyces ipomoeae]|nr:hypothetical protein [Streptomyces ipomoeae]